MSTLDTAVHKLKEEYTSDPFQQYTQLEIAQNSILNLAVALDNNDTKQSKLFSNPMYEEALKLRKAAEDLHQLLPSSRQNIHFFKTSLLEALKKHIISMGFIESLQNDNLKNLDSLSAVELKLFHFFYTSNKQPKAQKKAFIFLNRKINHSKKSKQDLFRNLALIYKWKNKFYDLGLFTNRFILCSTPTESTGAKFEIEVVEKLSKCPEVEIVCINRHFKNTEIDIVIKYREQKYFVEVKGDVKVIETKSCLEQARKQSVYAKNESAKMILICRETSDTYYLDESVKYSNINVQVIFEYSIPEFFI